MSATFDHNDHCVTEGWASHSLPPLRPVRGWWCRLIGHRLPPTPRTPNGISPSCMGRCARCAVALNWYVPGQHRFGSYDASHSYWSRPSAPTGQP